MKNLKQRFDNSSSLKMMIGTLLSRLSGQLRTIFLIAALGATGQMADSFDLANNVPTSLNLIITGGIFNALLVPQLVKLKKQDGGKNASDSLITFAIFAVFILTVVLTILTPLIITIISNPNWSSSQRNAAIFLGFLCMPQIFFYGIYVIFGQLLASRERFGLYSIAPILNNIVSIIIFATFIFLTKNVSVRDECSARNVCSIFDSSPLLILLGLGATAGIAAQALILLIPIIKKNLFTFRLFSKTNNLDNSTLKDLFHLAKWSFLMIVVEQVAALFYVHIASGAPAAAVANGLSQTAIPGNAAYSSALIIYIIPHSLITLSISTTMFTRLSNHVHSDDLTSQRETYQNSVSKVILLLAPFVAALTVIGVPVTKALIPSVSQNAVVPIGNAVSTLSFVLIFAGVFQMTTRLFFAHCLQKQLFFIELPEYVFIVLLVKMSTSIFSPNVWVELIGYSRAIGGFAAMIFIMHYASKKILKDRKVFWHLFNLLGFTFFAYLVTVVLGNALYYEIITYLNVAEFELNWEQAVIICMLVGTVIFGVYFAILKLSGNIKKLSL